MGYPVDVDPHPADWDGPRKKGAGYARNAEMVKLGADICLAFIQDESKGATHCSKLAEEAGIETVYFRRNSMGEIEKQRKFVRDELVFEDARIVWKNFSGTARQFNETGKRVFHIVLDEQQFHELSEIGWEPKIYIPKLAENPEPMYHLPVSLNYKFDEKGNPSGLNPNIYFITESTQSKTLLVEETTGLADQMTFERIDLTIRAYNWSFQGKYGVKAYLKTMYGILHEDPLDILYQDYQLEGGDGTSPILENIIDAEAAADSGWIQEAERLGITMGDK